MTLGVSFSFFGSDEAVFDQTADIRVVAGEAGNAAIPHQVQAAVPDMGVVQPICPQHHGRGSGAHAPQFRVRGRILMNARVGFTKRRGKKGLRIAIMAGGVEMLDGIDGNAARILSAFMPAHAVGHHGQSALLFELYFTHRFPVAVTVFVTAPLAAHIAHAGNFDPALHPNSIFAVFDPGDSGRRTPLPSEPGLYPSSRGGTRSSPCVVRIDRGRRAKIEADQPSRVAWAAPY